jgi:hypothetical protein
LGNSSGDEINSSVIRIYDAAGNVIETHEHAGDFKEWPSVAYVAALTDNAPHLDMRRWPIML